MLPHNTTKLSDIKNVVRYILHYAEDHTVLLPCRIPGYNRDDIQILPSSTTKQEVWQLYHSTASAGADMKAVGYSLVCHRNFGPGNFGPGDQNFQWKIGPAGPIFSGKMVRLWKIGPNNGPSISALVTSDCCG